MIRESVSAYLTKQGYHILTAEDGKEALEVFPPSEWKILSAIVKYPKKVFARDDLIDLVFGPDFDGYDRVIDTHIKNLRKKIETV